MVTKLGLRPTARECGISHVALLKAESEDRVPKRVDGLFDVAACKRALSENSSPKKSRAGRSQQKRPRPDPTESCEDDGEEDTAPRSGTLAAVTLQLEKEKLRALRQKTDREEGSLVEVTPINAFVAGMIIKARDELVRIGAELADQLARESDPAKCRAFVDDRISQALENLKAYKPPA